MKNHFLAISMFCLGCITLSSCKDKATYDIQETVRPVKVVQLEASKSKNFEFQGIIESDKKSRLAFRAGGQIVKLTVDIGDRVNAGQVIAELDKRDLLEKLESDRVKFSTAQSIYNRDLELAKRQAISEQEIEISRNNFEQARYAYENTKSQVNDMTLVSPFNGIIEDLNVELFQRVSAGEEIVKLIDPRDLIVQMKIADRNFEYLKQSPDFQVSIDAISGARLNVKLLRYLEASPSGIGIPVFLKFDEKDLSNYIDKIRPGFAATIFMSVENINYQEGSYLLPLSSVFSDPDSKQMNVWIVEENNTITKQAVVTGEIIGSDRLEIISGVAQNDRIVSAGVNYLMEGQKVKILQE